jgi:mRNA-degrading endonuclease YafQ of YafQ-DinJ toxin-antitoxin module
VFVGLWLSLAAPQAGAASPCPSTTNLTPGDQSSLSSAVLYCGGTYADTWNANGQVDWIAFYTTVDDATVVVHYISTSAPGGPQVGASFYDPGKPPQVDASGDNSADDQDQQGLSYTFATPGIHYVELSPVFGDSNGVGYQVWLTGQVSAAPGGAVGPPPGTSTTCPPRKPLTPGDQGSAAWPVLYCGGIYSDTWDGSGESDWIAFYTTVDDATVVVRYVSTGATGGPQVGASFFDPGSSPGSPSDDVDGDLSADRLSPQGVSYTFATPGVHYVHLYAVYGDSTGIGYQVELSGQWSQTRASGAVSPPPGTATSCPASATLTPGAQGSAAWPALYCGGTYAQTWDGSGESDWIAFYTTVDDATVVVHYVSTGATGGPQVGASFFDPGSSPGSPSDDVDGDTSGDPQNPQGVSYTFATPGLHYVELYSVYGDSTGIGYQFSLSGQWSQTRASGAVSPPPGTATSCPASATLTPGAQGSAAWPALYCGGTYAQTWDGSGESDWIAFYTILADATVVVHYVSTGTAGGPHVGASFLDPGSSPGSVHDDVDGDTSGDAQDSQTLSYTFPTPGLHYVELYSVYGDSTGIGYQFSLSGAWSQTPPSTTSPPPSVTAPPKRSSVKVLSHKVSGDTVTLVVRASAAGSLKVSGAGLTTVVKHVVKAGKLTLEVRLSKVGTTRLRHDHDKLKLTIKVALTPSTLASSSASVTVTLR